MVNLGLSFKEFNKLSFKQFDSLTTAYDNQFKRDSRERWEIARMMAYSSMIVHVKKGSLKYEDIRTPYDNEKVEKEQLSEEEIRKQLMESKAFWEKRDKEKNGKTNN